MRIRFQLESGNSAEVLETDGGRLVLLSTMAAPPGSSLEGEWTEVEARVRIKVRGCQRDPSGGEVFRIEGRFVNLGKSLRAQLLAHDPSRGAG